MFQIEKRTNSISIADGIREEINQKIALFQEKTGQSANNATELFKLLVDFAANNVNKEITPEAPKVEDVKQEVNTIQSYNNQSNHDEFLNKVKDARVSHGLQEDCQVIDILDYCVKTSMQQPTEIEVTKEVERKLSESEVLLEFNDKERTLLDEISKRRFAKRKSTHLEPLPELCKQMIMNDNVIFNLGGEFYTGF